MSRSDANSHSIAIVLMLVILFVFAALVLVMLLRFPSFALGEENEVPAIFQITSISHEEGGRLNYDSRVVLLHTGTVTYENRNLMAKFYKNDIPVNCHIDTMHGEDFIPTHHNGIQTMSGEGCKGATWLPNEKLALDFTDKTFHPGDLVRAEIYDTTSGLIISSHSYIA